MPLWMIVDLCNLAEALGAVGIVLGLYGLARVAAR